MLNLNTSWMSSVSPHGTALGMSCADEPKFRGTTLPGAGSIDAGARECRRIRACRPPTG